VWRPRFVRASACGRCEEGDKYRLVTSFTAVWSRCTFDGTATIREAPVAELEVRNPDQADEIRPFVDKGRVDVLKLATGTVGRGTFEPGWRWSEHVKPIAGTDSCQSAHLAYCVSGRMGVRMDDGTEKEIGPGDVVVIPPGHDAWVVGNEPCVQVDFTGMGSYAKKT
jgi:quercetin dioxygenase-like cupin family protein